MIELETPITEFWHPQGDENGNPLKVKVDHAEIVCVRTDYGSRTIEVGIRYGYLHRGNFEQHLMSNGSMRIDSFAICDNDPKRPETRAFSDFMSRIQSRGAPTGEFRKADLEEELVRLEIVKARKAG